MSSLLLDTNIVIRAINNESGLQKTLSNKIGYISFVTEIELLSWPSNTIADIETLQAFMDQCIILEYTIGLKDIIIEMRKLYKLKLADAIIAASAIYFNLKIMTGDKAFQKVKELDLEIT
jgi:predicted nucleic acid-binding protein